MTYTAWSVVFGETPNATKWSQLGQNDAGFKDGTNFDDSIILPKHLLTGNGADWDWDTWSPTFTNLTVGNGTVVAKYITIGKFVFFYISVTFGSTSSMSAAPYFTLPVNASADYVTSGGKVRLFNCQLSEDGASDYGGYGLLDGSPGTHTCEFVVYLASGTYLAGAQVNSTVPFTWGTNDRLQITGWYQKA